MKKLLIVLLALVLVVIALAQAFNVVDLMNEGKTLDVISDKVIGLKDCEDIYWEETEDTYGTCSGVKPVQICENQTNEDGIKYEVCSNELMPYEYHCLIDSKTIEKYRQDCTTSGYVVDEIIRLYTQDYVCSTEEEDNKVIVICDHKRDSDRNGKCRPGESCMKFVIDGEKVEKYERNSRYDWVKEDKTFVFSKASVEVLK